MIGEEIRFRKEGFENESVQEGFEIECSFLISELAVLSTNVISNLIQFTITRQKSALRAHMRARGAFVEHGGRWHTAPAPRFDRTPNTIRDSASARVERPRTRWQDGGASRAAMSPEGEG